MVNCKQKKKIQMKQNNFYQLMAYKNQIQFLFYLRLSGTSMSFQTLEKS